MAAPGPSTSRHGAAVLVFLWVVLAHWSEHLLQAVQIHVLGWRIEQAVGVLGLGVSVVAHSEWLHFGYNTSVVVGLLAVRGGFAGRAREWLTAALVVQLWHLLEHSLLLGQALAGRNLLGREVPTSIVQLALPRVELHLFYNAVVLAPILVALYHHLYPADGEAWCHSCHRVWRRLAAVRSSGARLGVVSAAAVAPFAVVLPTAFLEPPVDPNTADPVPVLIERVSGGRLGEPLQFRARGENPSNDARALKVTFWLAPAGRPQAAVPVSRWQGAVGGDRTAVHRGEVTSSQWFAAPGRFVLSARPAPAGSRPLSFSVTASPVAVPRFAEVAEQRGLRGSRGPWSCGAWAAGAAWGDVDGDRDLDLFLPRGARRAGLFINEGGRFRDEARTRGIALPRGRELGAVFADYDNDGDQDLHVNSDGPNRLYRNDGTGRLRDVAMRAGVADDGPAQSASFGDYDADGHLDLYVANHLACRTGEKYSYPDRLYRNEGDGTFTDRTSLLHEDGSTLGAGFQALWFDYDGDGDVDLYLGNDAFGPTPERNMLWRNDGPRPGGGWQFREIGDHVGAGLLMNTMGIGAGDHDRDGDLDLALSNMGKSVLLGNQGDGSFRNRAAWARVQRPLQRASTPSITWGAAFADLNNDGWEDLYVAAGRLEQGGPQANALFTNAGAGRFLDHSAPSGADDPGVSRGVAVADYDRDGRLDLFVANQLDGPRLFRNVTGRSGHWLAVDTIGRRSNRDGCGAHVVLVTRSATMVRHVFCGGTSLASGNDSTVHFGLGHDEEIVSLRIAWPSGAQQTMRDVEADRIVEIREPPRE